MWIKISYWISEHLTFIGLASLIFLALRGAFKRQRQEKIGAQRIKDAVAKNLHEPATMHPEINEALCIGCGSCTKACPEGDILQLINHKSVLVAPTQCVGHGACEAVCPMGAITLAFGTKTRGMDIPRISPHYETNVRGLYIAGELGGMGLISNAIKQGILASEHALKNLDQKTSCDIDLLIIGAGPAGLAAALQATSMGKKYLCIEQNSFGGTVYNFPRQKVVMTVKATLPMVGKLKFPGNKVTKEELLSTWIHIRKTFKLRIVENTKFETLEKQGNIFQVKTSQGIIKAKKVILALGVRGSPRKLGLPNEDLAKVTYNLIDPEQYQGNYIAIVGGGNAALEAAQMLSEPQLKNKVVLLVRGPAMDRANAENIDLVNAAVNKGHLTLWYKSVVKEIKKDEIIIDQDGHLMTLPNHFLFVFAGTELPHKFLMSLGIKIDKKFGEGIKRTA